MINEKLIVLTAPSGAGKTTIARKLLDEFPRLRFSTSATTRPRRKNEENGKDYFFLSDQAFDETIDNNGFLEWEYYGGNRYGTLQSEVDKLMKNGYIPLFDVEVNGARNIKRIYHSKCAGIFIQPPSIAVLKQRLINRGTETEESLAKRLKRAKEELSHAENFDFNVVNDHLETSYKKVKNIIESFIDDSKT
jgi:guanylate kinase